MGPSSTFHLLIACLKRLRIWLQFNRSSKSCLWKWKKCKKWSAVWLSFLGMSNVIPWEILIWRVVSCCHNMLNMLKTKQVGSVYHKYNEPVSKIDWLLKTHSSCLSDYKSISVVWKLKWLLKKISSG